MTDDLDLGLIHALQLNPRASWAELSRILRAEPSTLSRRWHHLVDARVVWATCYAEPHLPGPLLGGPRRAALIEIVCEAGRRDEVIDQLVVRHEVLSLSCTTGARDLCAVVLAADATALHRLAESLAGSVRGITATRTHPARRSFFDGAAHRVGALSAQQREEVLATLPTDARPAQPTRAHLDVVDALAADVRRPVTSIAQQLGKSVASVSRSIDSLLGAPWMRWRIDLAHTRLGWEASAMLWLDVRQDELERVATVVSRFPQARGCVSIAGPANLVLALWLRELDELDEIELALTTTFPAVRLVDRWLIPRDVKRAGHVLDADGLWSAYVPLEHDALRPAVTLPS